MTRFCLVLSVLALVLGPTGTIHAQQPAPSPSANPVERKPQAETQPAKPQAGNAATTQTAPATPPAVPPPEVLLMLVRTTLAALNQANFTGNYGVLRGLGTPALQTKNSAEQLATAFKPLRATNADLSPVLVLTPQLTEAPTVTPQSVLRLRGFFPTKPLQVNFAIDLQPVSGRWLIDGLSVATVPVAQPTPLSAPKQ